MILVYILVVFVATISFSLISFKDKNNLGVVVVYIGIPFSIILLIINFSIPLLATFLVSAALGLFWGNRQDNAFLRCLADITLGYIYGSRGFNWAMFETHKENN